MPRDVELSPPLSRYIRYRDLEAAGIAGSWTQLHRMMAAEGFPEGVMLSANVRAWPLDQVERWLASRPTAKKKVTPFRGRRRHHEREQTVR